MLSSVNLSHFVKKLDIFGSLIQFNYKKETTLKTLFGGILTILSFFLGAFLIYFFGKDIILKDKPFLTFTRLKTTNDSEVYLKNFPIMFTMTTPGGETLPVNDLLELTVDLLVLDKLGRYEVLPNIASLIPCNADKHFGQYKEFLLDPKTALPSNVYCVNPFNNDTKFVNDYGSTNSKSLYIKFMECDEVKHNRTCAPKNIIDQWLGEFFIQTYFIDYFIDPTAFRSPVTMYLNSGSQRVTNSLYTRKYYIMKDTKILTDDGIFFDDIKETSVKRLELAYIDIYTSERDPSEKYAVTWESMTIFEVYSRSYIKIFDILAKLGGLFNVIYIMAKFFCQYISETSFYLQQAIDLVNFDEFDDENDFDINNLNVIPFNNANNKSLSLRKPSNRRLDVSEKQFDINNFKKEQNSPDETTYGNDKISTKTSKLRIKNEIKSIHSETDVTFNLNNLEKKEKEKTTKNKKFESNAIDENLSTNTGRLNTQNSKIELNSIKRKPHKHQIELVEIPKLKKKESKVILVNDKKYFSSKTMMEVSKNLKTYGNHTQNIGYIDYLKKTCGPNKKGTYAYKFYRSIINYFEKHLDIAQVVRVNYDLEMIKYLFFSHLKDNQNLFKLKVSIQDLLIEEFEREEEEDENEIQEQSMNEELYNRKKVEDKNLQNKVQELVVKLREQLIQKKLIEDTF